MIRRCPAHVALVGAVGTVVTVALLPAARGPYAPIATAAALPPAPVPSVPLVFPVLGSCRWSDTFGAPRDGSTRKHIGQDLPAPKMRPLLACFDGIWTGSGIIGDNGWSAAYYHINNDTPGTDDGKGGEEFAWAPGVRPGTHVVAGQHVAYCGDSGNAEDAGAHLHFELHGPQGVINAARLLQSARKVTTPRYPIEERTEVEPRTGEVRLDGEVRVVDPTRGVLQVRVAAWRNIKRKLTVQTAPKRLYLKTAAPTDLPAGLAPGDVVAAVVKGNGRAGEALAARNVVLLRGNAQRWRFVGGEQRSVPPSSVPGRAPEAPAPSPNEVVLFDFENTTYAGWQLEGDCWGRGPEDTNFANGLLIGWVGMRFASTAHAGRPGALPGSGVGRAVSPPFRLAGTALHLLVAGGNHPERCTVRLLVDGEPVASATGETPYHMRPVAWDIRPWRGRTARIEIRDDLRTFAHPYIHVDRIRMTGLLDLGISEEAGGSEQP